MRETEQLYPEVEEGKQEQKAPNEDMVLESSDSAVLLYERTSNDPRMDSFVKKVKEFYEGRWNDKVAKDMKDDAKKK